MVIYFLIFVIRNLKNQRHTLNIDLFLKFLKDQFHDFFEIDHQNNDRSDNRIKNLQLLTHKQNVEKSRNKTIISTCTETGKERKFISLKTASIELGINHDSISKICRKKHKKATSKKDGCKYTFRYLD